MVNNKKRTTLYRVLSDVCGFTTCNRVCSHVRISLEDRIRIERASVVKARYPNTGIKLNFASFRSITTRTRVFDTFSSAAARVTQDLMYIKYRRVVFRSVIAV